VDILECVEPVKTFTCRCWMASYGRFNCRCHHIIGH